MYRRLGLFDNVRLCADLEKRSRKLRDIQGQVTGMQLAGPNKFQEHPSNLFLRYVTTVPQSLLLIIDPLATIDVNIVDHRRLREAGS